LLESFYGLDLKEVFANDMREPAYLAFFGLVPLPPIEDADSAYVIFMELLNQPVPPKDVTIIMGGRREVESLRDESSIADGWKESIPNPSRHLSG